MEVIKLKATETLYQKTVSTLQSGGVVVLPTDTVYGLACDSENLEACRRIYEIKGRDFQRPLALFLREPEQLSRYVEPLNPVQTRVTEKFLPGPLTVVLKSKTRMAMIAPEDKIGIRIPDVPFISEIIRRLGRPLATTSANISGEVEISSPRLLKKQFQDTVDLLVAGNDLPGPPSTVIDLATDPPAVLRKGKIPIWELEQALGRRVKLAKGVSFSVLLVCTGNLCRSPMAKGILKEKVGNKPVLIYSAGTDTADGLPPTPFAVQAAKVYHADISRHRSTILTQELIAASDLVLVMDQHHYDRVITLAPEAKPKTYFLRGYENGSHDEIEDPMGGPLTAYQETAKLIEQSLRPVARDIKRRFEEV